MFTQYLIIWVDWSTWAAVKDGLAEVGKMKSLSLVWPVGVEVASVPGSHDQLVGRDSPKALPHVLLRLPMQAKTGGASAQEQAWGTINHHVHPHRRCTTCATDIVCGRSLRC